MYNANLISHDALLNSPMSKADEQFVNFCVGKMHSLPGGVMSIREIERLYAYWFSTPMLGPRVAVTDLYRHDERREAQIRLVRQTMVHVARRLCPHRFFVPNAEIPEHKLVQFRVDQGQIDVGHAVAIYSYTIGTHLYFSDSTEAMMARFVFSATGDREALPV